MRKILILILILAPVLCHAQNLAYNGHCQLGGQLAQTQGLSSTNTLLGSFPSCTVKVFNTGTLTVSTIFSTPGGGGLSNPFTANVDGSFLFFASPTLCYDVTISGGTPNALPSSFTFTDICLGSGTGSGGSNPPASPVTTLQFNLNGTLFGSIPNANLGSFLVSQGTGSTSIFQSMPLFDVRSSQVGFDCTGAAAMDTAMQSIPTTFQILVPIGCIVRLSSNHTYSQAFQFVNSGQLKPDTGVVINLTGPVLAGSYQIFTNAQFGQGAIDFTGNTATFDVLPEWWGAGTTLGGGVNVTAIQAAIYGAFGCNVNPSTTCRTNGSNLNQYNKPLSLCGLYAVSGELHWYHVINFIVKGCGRLSSGLIQSSTNQRLIDGQSDAYGVFRDLQFSTTASQDLAHPLADIDFNGSQGVDIKPQFIDFYNDNWNGAQLAKIGVRIAGSGGGAQGSNFNFYNNIGLGFTEAAYMIGSGSGCIPTQLATNAIQIAWYGGDIQANHAYGIEDFGGAGLKWDGGTAENGTNQNLGGINQTGADFCANNIPNAGGPFTVEHVRSESPTLLAPAGGAGSSGPWNLVDAVSLDDISGHGAGGSALLGDLIEGESSCGHGLWWKVTTAGTFSGIASRSSPLTATGGSATTIVDSVGGFTVNAWVGFYVCTLSPANTPPEYCLITSNTANTFTCSAGFVTDFPVVGTANPVNGTLYDIQPAWTGTTVTSGTATLTRDDTTYSGVNQSVNTFFPGKRVAPSSTAVIDNMQLTRADWAQVGIFPEAPVVANEVSVLVGSPPTTGTGNGSISLNPYYERTWTYLRNGVGEVPLLARKDYGTRVLHWFSAGTAGGPTVNDTYAGGEPVAPTASSIAGSGDWFILNNSLNTGLKWTFNSNGSASFPGVIVGGGGTPTITGTGACATVTTQVGGLGAGLFTCTGATGASTIVITPGITAPHGFRCSADDETTNANKLTQSTQSVTTCTIAGTVNANDVISFGPIQAF